MSNKNGMVGKSMVVVKGDGTTKDCDKCVLQSLIVSNNCDCSCICTSEEVSGGKTGVYFVEQGDVE